MTPFTGIADTDFSAALAGKDALVFPEQEPAGAGVAPALSAAAKQVIRDFVSGGGNFVTFGQHKGVMDAVFGYSAGAGVTSVSGAVTKQAGAADTAYASGPATLPANSAVYGIAQSGLPAGARVPYSSGANAHLFTVANGSGTVTYLGWDWFNSNPPNGGGADGGWQSLLSLSTTADPPGTTPTPTPTPGPTPAPSPAPAPACLKDYAFELVQVTTAGCLRVEPGADGTPVRVVSTDAVKVNGMSLPTPTGGRRFVATLPTKDLPGGRVQCYACTLRPGCRAALLRRPRPGERVSVQVVGMRSDLETGPAARVTLRTKAYRAGTRPRGRGRWAPLRTCG